MQSFFAKKQFINLNGRLFDISTPKIMGILNVTPDSFYPESRFNSSDAIIEQLEKMVLEGADIIDIGGYSSRPGAENITEQEEIKRLTMALELTLKRFPNVPVSIDTFRSGVIRKLIENYSISMINDISGGILDDQLIDTVADLKIPYVLMHMKGNPQTMQQFVNYNNLIGEQCLFFSEKINQLRLKGISDIIIDLGFGFSKSLDQNYDLLRNLDFFKIFKLPVLVGISRKSMIYKLLNQSPHESLNGTSILNTLAMIGNAEILRVHDVKQAKELVILYTKYKQM